jgi:hypothetical protein
MSEGKKYLLRKTTGDQLASSDQELKDWFARGQCKPADLLFDFAARAWTRVGEHPAFQSLIGTKPAQAPEKRLVYYMGTGNLPMLQGPFTTKEIHGRIHARELCLTSWVFVEGDKEWRQIRAVKVLADMMPALPTDLPEPPAAEPVPESPPPKPAAAAPSLDEITFEEDDAPPAAPAAPPRVFSPTPAPTAVPEMSQDDFPEREEATMAISALGLSLKADLDEPPAAPSAPPAKPMFAPIPTPGAAPSAPPGPPPGSRAPAAPPSSPKASPAGASIPGFQSAAQMVAPPARKPDSSPEDSFDGLTAEIPMDPIWLVKPGNSETVSGPFRFLEVVKFLDEGRLTKNDKISKVGTNRFVKIQQQYEFNVKHSLETVVEHGVEKQKILIKRRHPRVAYMTGVQVLSRHGTLAGNCINISAGGILLEMSKAELALGEILEIKLLPGLIQRSISCKAQVIGKIPKMPPGFALKFEDLKNEDKEAIEFFVQEMLKREL